MKCGNCKSENITTHKDIGSDIGTAENGVYEESQHVEICNDCNWWRFNRTGVKYCDTIEEYNHYGKWEKYSEFLDTVI